MLRTLEVCLRDVSTDVHRSGEEIVLHGLGPSPLAVNRRDTTVLRVQNEENENITVIRADVTFQASSLLGNAPQCEVVRSKLDSVFERVRMQIDVDAGSVPEKSPTEPAILSINDSEKLELSVDEPVEAFDPVETESLPDQKVIASVVADSVPDTHAELTLIEQAETNVEAPAEAAPAEDVSSDPVEIEVASHADAAEESKPDQTLSPAESLQSAPPVEEPSEVSSAVPVAEPVIAAASVELPTAIPPLPPEPVLHARKSPRAFFVETAPVAVEPTLAMKDPAPAKSHAGPRHNWTAAMLAGALLLFGPGLYLGHRQQQAAPAPQPIVSHATELDPTPAPPPEPAHEATASEDHSVDSSDPQLWLQSWLAAQASGDATAQASFYAEKVDRYLGKRNVANAEILADKQSSIIRRQGRWSVKLEDVNLRHNDNGEVSVYLVKHYEAQTEPAEIAEQFVPSHLELRRIAGQWKIISEQDLPTIEPAQTH